MRIVGTLETSAASRAAVRLAIAVARRDEHFAAHVAAFFLARELILEMHAGRAGFDHRFDQFEDIERAAETGFGIGHDRREPVDLVLAFGVRDLVGALQRLVDPPNDRRNAVRRVKTLVGIHLPGEIRVGRDLPAAEINCLQPGLHLLHRLIAGERAERGHERLASAAASTISPRRGARESARGRRCPAGVAHRLTSRCARRRSSARSLDQSGLIMWASSGLPGSERSCPGQTV